MPQTRSMRDIRSLAAIYIKRAIYVTDPWDWQPVQNDPTISIASQCNLHTAILVLVMSSTMHQHRQIGCTGQ